MISPLIPERLLLEVNPPGVVVLLEYLAAHIKARTAIVTAVENTPNADGSETLTLTYRNRLA